MPRPLYALEITLVPNENEGGTPTEPVWTFLIRDKSVIPAGI
jgi:hypothetical protein